MKNMIIDKKCGIKIEVESVFKGKDKEVFNLVNIKKTPPIYFCSIQDRFIIADITVTKKEMKGLDEIFGRVSHADMCIKLDEQWHWLKDNIEHEAFEFVACVHLRNRQKAEKIAPIPDIIVIVQD